MAEDHKTEGNGADPFFAESEFLSDQKLVIDKPSQAQYGEHFDHHEMRWVPHREDYTDGEQMVELKGQEVKVTGTPYRAQAGPHQGEVMVPCTLRPEVGEALVAVPEKRLKPAKRTTRVSVELSEERYREIFGKDPPTPDWDE